jgi:hypothetical protein
MPISLFEDVDARDKPGQGDLMSGSSETLPRLKRTFHRRY